MAATIPNELNINVDLRDQLASFLDGMHGTTPRGASDELDDDLPGEGEPTPLTH